MIQENDYIIKPVENLPNVGSLAPIDQHTGKRKRQGGRNNRRSASDQQSASDDLQNEVDRPADTGSIDYHA